jgi:hypothetical protein
MKPVEVMEWKGELLGSFSQSLDSHAVAVP